MKISNQPPPDEIYKKAQEKWGVNFEAGVIFTYGDTIYAKNQAFYGKEMWWYRYLKDDDFRLAQELEAYRNQVKWFNNNIKNRNERFKMINKIARDLSGSMYGNIVSYQEALRIINL